MIKNDPYKLLEKHGIKRDLLADKSKEGLDIYDETVESLKEFPKDKALKDMAEQIGQGVIVVLKEDVKMINSILEDEATQTKKKAEKKAQSKKVIEKSDKIAQLAAECREKMKAERKRKIESGEIKAPVKRKLSTRLKEGLKKIVGMMPKAVKEDEKKIAKTENAMKIFLSDLKGIWGMNVIKPIETELKEKFTELKEKAQES